MHRVVLLTGSNDTQREQRLAEALRIIDRAIGRVIAHSEVCYSTAWGFHSEQEFANQALIVESELEPLELLERALECEQIVGRDRAEELRQKQLSQECYADRVIDIDVIFYDDEQITHPRLEVPHPRLHLREFALRPLSQIMGDYVHPKFGRSIHQILEELMQQTQIKSLREEN